MNWNQLTTTEQLEVLNKESSTTPVLIFKHSTRCGVSAFALKQFQRDWDEKPTTSVVPYYLDLLNHRSISNTIAQMYGIRHESPQALLIKNGICVYHAEHSEIDLKKIVAELI